MTLTVETGAALSGADTYVDIAYADAYLSSMGYTIWAPLLDAEKEAALRMAARYLDSKSYTGTRYTATQALAWPRYGGMFDREFQMAVTDIPTCLKRAQCEAAIRAAQGTLTADVSGGFIIEETVGKITKRYSDYSKSATKTIQVVQDLLKPILDGMGSANFHRVNRV